MESLIGVVFGWALGIITVFFTTYINRRTQKKDTARLLLTEIRYNEETIRKLAGIHEQISSGQQLKDKDGNPVSINFGKTDVTVPFSFSTFDATLDRHALFDRTLLDSLYRFYRILRQAKWFTEIAEKGTTPLAKESWNKNVFSHSKSAMELLRKTNLLKSLEKLAKESE